ncbi:MAG: rhomboid family intramembrane serine protease [Candidatus Nanohaloarchaea archaeon]
MAECSECGKESMSFTCRYCGEKFCPEHRLPENHDCQGLNESDTGEEWFEEKNDEKDQASKTSGPQKPAKYKKRKQGLGKDILKTLKSNYTLAIIGLTTLSFILQYLIPQNLFFDLLVLNPEVSELLLKPWSLLTVMLLHAAPFHIFANMVTFYFFGTPLERLIGGKKMLKLYIASGLIASLAYVGFYHLLILLHGTPQTAGLAVGASGAVVAIVGAVSRLYPDAEVLLYFVVPMKIKTAVYAFGGLEVFNLSMKLIGVQLPLIGMMASSAHLAGLLVGLYYGEKLADKYRRKTSVFNPLGV